jgi:putative flippase GtrA
MKNLLKKFADRTFARFVLVGVINTLFGTAIMFVFYNVFDLSYWLSSASNYFFGSILSYFLNKYYTFRYKKRDWKVVGRFALNIAACYLIAYGIAKPLIAALMSGFAVNVQENVAMVCGMGLFVVLNYLGQRFFAFKEE